MKDNGYQKRGHKRCKGFSRKTGRLLLPENPAKAVSLFAAAKVANIAREVVAVDGTLWVYTSDHKRYQVADLEVGG